MKRTSVSITIVTYNSARYIERCLESILEQSLTPVEIVVIDNASTDGTRDILQHYEDSVLIRYNAINTGFAVGQNQAIRETTGDWVLTLNPDVVLEPEFLARLLKATSIDPEIGSVCGKLLRLHPNGSIPAQPRIDSAGIFFTPAMRHFDRGWNQPDGPEFQRTEYVFGASAAAALYRRELIAAVSVNGLFFDPDFFAYREDADVAWRSQLLGWKTLYMPNAVAYHVRRVTPENRRSLPASINRHSVKNRFLLRIKNITPGLFRRSFWPATGRDLLVIGSCLINESSSLPAFWDLAKSLPRAITARREIMRRRKISDEELAGWFDFSSTSWPLASQGEVATRQ
jgi:GT2 family glycosyltransferase